MRRAAPRKGAPPSGGAPVVAAEPPLAARIRRFLVPEGRGVGVVAAAPAVPVGTLFRRFWPDARPYRRWLAAGLLFAALLPVVELAQVWLFKVVVDDVLIPRDLSVLTWIAVATVALTVVSGLLQFCDEYVSAWAGEHMLLSLRRRLYAHLLRQSPDVLDRRKLGDLLARLTGDIQAIEGFLLGAVAEALSAALRILLFGAALFYLAWDLALVSLFAAPLFWLTARRFGRLIRHASREQRRRAGSLSSVAEEGLANAVLVQAYNAQELELDRFSRENEGIVASELAAARLRALFNPIVEVIEIVGALVVIAWGAWALQRGDLTVGGLLAFLTYLGLLYRPLRDLGSLGTAMFEASAAAERVLELLDREPLVRDRRDAVRLAGTRGAVSLDEVSFRYPGADRLALERVSLQVAPGELLVVTGPSGSGKSTLARLLLRLFDPTAGSVGLDGHDLRELELRSVRENVGALLQDALVFDASVRENIAYGRPDASDAEIVAAARAAQAHEFVRALPAGYDTEVGQKGRTLSGGQRQRIALARLFLRDAPVVVLDEPLTGLDWETGDAVLAALRELTRGRTAIVITHDPESIPDATATLVLEHGRVIRHYDPRMAHPAGERATVLA